MSEFEIIPIFGFWAALAGWAVQYAPVIAGVATVAGAGYSIYANEDAKRRQKNAIERAENQQAAALSAATTQEEIFDSLQNLNGLSLQTDISEVARQEQTKRLWIYGGIALAIVGVIWFVMKKKKRK